MFCSACGERCPEGARFCHRCGAGLHAQEAEGSGPRPGPSRRSRRVPVRALGAAALVAGVALLAVGGVALARGGEETETPAVAGLGEAVAEAQGEAPPPTEAAAAAEPGAAVETSSSEPVDPLAGWQECANDVYGFALRYPPGWLTAAATAEQACRFFDPRAFEADEDGPTAVTAVAVYVFPGQPFDAYASAESGDAAVRLERTDLTVNGRRAQRVEGSIDTETGATRLYEYGLDVDGLLVIVTTREGDAPDFAAARAAVDGIVASLETQ